MSKTLGLALSKAETAETKQRAKVDALAAYERRRLLAELDVCTRLFLDDDAAVQAAVPPPPVPPPVPLSPAKVLPAQALAAPVHAVPDSASVPPTPAPTPAPASPAKVLIPAQDPAAPVQTAVPPMPVSATPVQACVHCEAPSETIKPCSSCPTRRKTAPPDSSSMTVCCGFAMNTPPHLCQLRLRLPQPRPQCLRLHRRWPTPLPHFGSPAKTRPQCPRLRMLRLMMTW